MSKLAAGIDIGGSTITGGLFDRNLKLVHHCQQVDSRGLQNGNDLVAATLAGIDEALAEHGKARADLAGIGIGCPGPLDIKRGVVLETPNLTQLNGYALRDRFSEESGVPVWLDNDANVFTLGEARAGAGQGAPYVVGITLGTGLGWGIVLNEKTYHGATGTAAEYGLSAWGPGRSWEDHISIRGLLNTFRELGGTAETPREVSELADRGDLHALRAWREYGAVLGLAISHAVNMLDPHVVVLGGAMAQAWDYFAPAMLESLHSNIFTLPREQLKVLPSQLGKDAALVGAASQVTFP
ncbi:MAG: ROK family protein [Candidatus Neomarinimicrobiota bacterium]